MPPELSTALPLFRLLPELELTAILGAVFGGRSRIVTADFKPNPLVTHMVVGPLDTARRSVDHYSTNKDRRESNVTSSVSTPFVWDVFISHASEDKARVAAPLARLLEHAGLRVWLDTQELRIGDSLRAKIDDGLARSRFGVVVLSPKYLEKRWTANELDAFFATEDQTRTRMLPVWHEVSAAQVASRSPLLAGRLAAQTSAGLDNVARAIALVVVSSIALAARARRGRFGTGRGELPQGSSVHRRGSQWRRRSRK
jgi:TIR domain